MPTAKGTLRSCKKGHQYYKSSDCPVCPICAAEEKPEDGFLSVIGAPARRALQGQGINTIQQLATNNNLVYLDMNEFFDSFANGGRTIQGINYTLEYISGGIFSLDGYTLTPRGNAILANEIIKKINRQYNSKIPEVDVSQFETVALP